MASENQPEYLRTWFLSLEEIDDLRFDESRRGEPIDSSPAWKHFAPLFASRGYTLRFIGDGGCSPQVDTSNGLGDPFFPSPNGPYIYHVPEGLELLLHHYAQPYGPWKTERPRITFAYDSLFRIVVIKAIPPTAGTNEREILSFLNSPRLRASPDNHTIPFIEFIDSEEGWPFIVMPAWMWTLGRFPKFWHVDDCFAIIIQCFEGLSFMHVHGIAHRDISPGNMVINHDFTSKEERSAIPVPFLSTWDFRIAFIDFGLSTKYTPGTDTSTWVASGFCGNFDYVSPENLASHETKAEYAVLPADVYSLAKVLDAGIKDQRATLNALRVHPQWNRPTFATDVLQYHVPQVESFLQKMLDIDPIKRPTAKEALHHFRAAREALPDYLRFSPPEGYAAEYGPSGAVARTDVAGLSRLKTISIHSDY